MLNHSATHLLHAALRQILGEHVTQKGSLVNAEYLRFDFSHPKPVSDEELRQIEMLVNQQVLLNKAVSKQSMSMDEAKNHGAMALFGEKYGDVVRVVSMGGRDDAQFSVELCGGTHVERTGDIGLFKIVQESGIAAGVRRIEAVSGIQALRLVNTQEQQLAALATLLKSDQKSLEQKVSQLVKGNRELEKQLSQLKAKLASSAGTDLSAQAIELKGTKLLVAEIDGVDSKALRETCDQLKNKLGSAIIVLATVSEGKVALVAGVTKDLTAKVKAGDLVNNVAAQVGGKGGGRPDMAMAGGTEAENSKRPLPQLNTLFQVFFRHFFERCLVKSAVYVRIYN